MMQPRGSTVAAFRNTLVSMALFLPLLFSRLTPRRPQLEPALSR